MTRRHWIAWIAAALLLAPAAAFAAAGEKYEAGRHYLELPFPQPVETGARIELREFFWYGCRHCYVLEPTLERYLKRLPKHVQFVRTPGVAPAWLVHAQAYYAFESMGALDKLHAPFFAAWHAKGRRLNDEQAIGAFVAEHGLDRQKFHAAFNSFGTRVKLERAKQQNVEFQVHSVPTLAVDGRYLTSPTLAGGEDAAMKVVDFLIQKAARERKKAVGR